MSTQMTINQTIQGKVIQSRPPSMFEQNANSIRTRFKNGLTEVKLATPDSARFHATRSKTG